MYRVPFGEGHCAYRRVRSLRACDTKKRRRERRSLDMENGILICTEFARKTMEIDEVADGVRHEIGEETEPRGSYMVAALDMRALVIERCPQLIFVEAL